MLRTYRWHGAMWRFEDGKAPVDAVLVEVNSGAVTPETPKKAPVRRTTRARKPRTSE